MDDRFSDWLANRSDDTPAPLVRDGTNIGDFTIVGFLGRGGSGEVYRAEHRLLKTPVAVKVLHRDDEAGKARFAREADILCKHSCPGFPRFFGYGEADGRQYLVTELLEERPLPTEGHEVAVFIRQIADAVGELHKLGFVHRDIKPSNILWRIDDGKPVPVLIDLGLAKPVSGGRQPDVGTLSVEGGAPVGVGTPGYAAPEQFTGGGIDFSADIHALGVLVNECFGGKPPRRWALLVNEATSSLPGRRFRSVADFSQAVALADGNAVLARAVQILGVIPFAASAIWMFLVLLTPLMPAGYEQAVRGSVPLLQELSGALIVMALLAVVPFGLFKFRKWAVRTVMVAGGIFTLYLLALPLADAANGYGSFESSGRLVLFFWFVPRSMAFLLLLFPKARALFAR